MVKEKKTDERVNLLINLGIFLCTGFMLLGSFWAYCEMHFAHAEALTSEVDSRKELKGEIDALYLRMIPSAERAPLRHEETLVRDK